MARYWDIANRCWHEPAVDTGDCGPGFLRNPDTTPVAGVPESRWFVAEDGATLRPPTTEEAASIDAAELAAAKERRYAEIDARTAALIETSGVVVNGESISCSKTAQQNMTALVVNNLLGRVTFPRSISATNGGQYQVESSEDLLRISGLMTAFVAGKLDEGRAIRLQVFEATTLAQVEAVEDSR
jgi:hypothetical protein